MKCSCHFYQADVITLQSFFYHEPSDPGHFTALCYDRPVLGALATQDGRYYGQGTMMGVFSLAMSTGIILGAIGAGLSMDLLGLQWSFINIWVIVLILTMAAAWLIRTGHMVQETDNKMTG